MCVYLNFEVDIVRADSGTGFFLRISKFCNFIKNETTAHMFSCEFFKKIEPSTLLDPEFCKVLKNPYYAQHVERAFSKENCFLKMSVYLFNIFNESQDNDHNTIILTCRDTSLVFLKNVDF